MQRLLVTGASGFFGSAVLRALRDSPVEIVAVSRRPLAEDVLTARIRQRRTDLVRDPLDALVRGCDTILHLAGSTARCVTPDDEARDRAINFDATARLIAAAARAAPGAAFLLAGSESQHGPGPVRPLRDGAADDPRTPYDRNKILAEAALAAETEAGRLRGVRLRFPTLYGPGPAVAAEGRGVVAAMARDALAGSPIRLFGDGSLLRDLLHVDDAAQALVAAARSADRLGQGSWLVASDSSRSILEVAERVRDAVRAATGRAPGLVREPAPAWLDLADGRNVVIDSGRFREATGWMPRIGFEEGVAGLVASLLPPTVKAVA